MKIRIKECMVNSRIYGEDGKLAGTIEGWPKNGPAREVCGADGTVYYRISREKGRLIVENMGLPQETGKIAVPFQYEEKPEYGVKGSGAPVLLRAPLAMRAVVPLTDGALTILQNRKRLIILEDETGRIGRITSIASLTSHEVQWEKEMGIYEAAMVFTVAEYMYHDDEMEVV